MKSSKINTSFEITQITELEETNSVKRFGLSLSKLELNEFLQKLKIQKIEISISFITKFIHKTLSKIPFQNYKMIERGFGYIPTAKDIKEDMLSLNGGTCATMNTFIGAVLYKIGFNVSLINGTMIKNNDHIAVLLNLESKIYTIDVGDGQPYFIPIPINNDLIIKHPFRTYRAISESTDLRIDFLIHAKWLTDVILHLEPRTFKEIYTTLVQHYTKKEFGPFWNGVRFAIYPNKEIIAIRDKTFILQKFSSIEKIKIRNHRHLMELTTQFLPNFRDQINLCFTKLQIL